MPVIAVTIVDQTVAVTQVGEIGLTGATGPTGTVSAAGSGTAGAPGIAFASDTNTGLFLAGSDILAVATGGVERVRFNASGKAEFTGNQSLSLSTGPTLTLSRTDSFDSNPSAVMASLLFKSHFDVIDNAKIYTVGTGSGYTGQLRFATNDGTGALLDRISVTPTGNVGIGTTSPGDKLEVVGLAKGIRLFTNTDSTLENGQLNRIDFYKHVDAGPINTIRVYNNSVFAAQGYSGSDLRFAFCEPNSSTTLYDRVTFTSTGNVGIGTSSPDAALSIFKSVTYNNSDTYPQLIVGNVAGATGKRLNIGYDDTANVGMIQAQNRGVDNTNLSLQRYGGNVGIGTTSPDTNFHVYGSGNPGATIESTSASGIAFLKLKNSTTNANWNVEVGRYGSSDSLGFYNGVLGAVMTIIPSGHVTPGADNTQNFGSGSLRWATIYAGTGTINTSDERYKVLREGGDLSDAEFAAWSNVRAIVYQDLDSFERKGSAARLHVGYSWQSIQAAFEAEGLDAARYGLWCEDALEAPVEKTRMVSRPVEGQTETIPVLDDDGEPVFEQVQETEEVEQPFEEVRVIDGAPVLVKGVRTVAQPVFDSVQIRDEDGELLFDTPQPIEDPETGELVEGDPIPRTAPVPRMIRKAKTETVPVMEEVEETFTEMEPTGETRGALRYNQCSVIEAAWLRRELASVVARLSALEAA